MLTRYDIFLNLNFILFLPSQLIDDEKLIMGNKFEQNDPKEKEMAFLFSNIRCRYENVLTESAMGQKGIHIGKMQSRSLNTCLLHSLNSNSRIATKK